MTEKKLPVPSSTESSSYGELFQNLPEQYIRKQNTQISIEQKSGIASGGTQDQTVFIADQIHLHADSVYKKLVEIHGGGVTFDPVLLKDIIVTIDAGVNEVLDEPIDFTLGISIEEKNKLNNHSKEYFEQFVELDFYPQFYKLDRFLSLKENQKSLQPKVDRIIQSLNRQIVAFQGNEQFEAILLKICTKLIDAHHEHLQGKENEILLVLYYFYCNCCIGRKTEEEKKKNDRP